MSDVVCKPQDNGPALIHERREHGLAVLTLFSAVGSRIERADEMGAVHLREHLFFRPDDRTALDALEARGGIIDAFTARDYVAYTVQVLPQYLPMAIDAIRALHRQQTWSDTTLAEERQVVIEEIARAHDSIRTSLHMEIYATAFPSMSLGYPPMGTPESLERLTRATLARVCAESMARDTLCLSLVSPRPHEEAFALCAGDWGVPPTHQPFHTATYNPSTRVVYKKRDAAQSACALIYPGVRTSACTPAIQLIETILTRGTNARLTKALRGDRGLVYDVRATHADYRDCGVFDITFGTRPETVGEVVSRITDALENLVAHDIDAAELSRAQHVLASALYLSDVHAAHIAKRAAHDYLFKGSVVSTEAAVAAIMRTTPQEIREAAGLLFSQPGVLVCLGPKEPF